MIKSNWFIALLGIILGIGTTAGVILLHKDEIIHAESPRSVLPSPANAPRDWVFWTDELNKLAADLKTEREALEEKARDLERVEQRLAGEREELRKVRTDLDGMRREVTDNIPKIAAAEKQNVKTLAKTYSAMKPKDAVAVMRELDDSSVVKILGVMKAEVVGAIFQEMAAARDADGTLAVRAARISEQLRLVQSAQTSSGKP
jgi:flagellar motility protein MotE (MotC chaperone)